MTTLGGYSVRPDGRISSFTRSTFASPTQDHNGLCERPQDRSGLQERPPDHLLVTYIEQFAESKK
jgi:hypothetical protein